MRRIVALTVFAAAVLGAPALAQSPAAVGEWTTVGTTAQGTFESSITIAEADGAYTIAIVDPAPPGGGVAPESTYSDIVVEGGTFSFTRTMAGPQGAFTMTYAGAVEGDSMTGTASGSFGDMPFEVPFTGTRK